MSLNFNKIQSNKIKPIANARIDIYATLLDTVQCCVQLIHYQAKNINQLLENHIKKTENA